MAGVIGFETFRRFVVRIDYGARTLALITPDTFDPRDAGAALGCRFYGHVPEIDAVFEGRWSGSTSIPDRAWNCR